MKKLLILGAAVMLLVPLVALADAYQFIISGDPVAASTENSRSGASSGTSLVTGAFTVPTAAASLEVCYLTWDESDGIALRSDQFRGMVIYVR